MTSGRAVPDQRRRTTSARPATYPRLLVAIVLLALLPSTGCGDSEQASSGAAAPPTVSTKVEGEIPEALHGRWFLVVRLQSPDRVIAMPATLEIARGTDGSITVDLQTGGTLPIDVQSIVEKKAGADTAWRPDENLLSRVASTWDAPPSSDDAVPASIDYTLVTPDHYEAAFSDDERARASEAVLTSMRAPRPLPGQNVPARIVDIVFFQRLQPDILEGDYLSVQVVGAPVPVPIVIDGHYTAYRLAASPPPSFWDRLRRRLG